MTKFPLHFIYVYEIIREGLASLLGSRHVSFCSHCTVKVLLPPDNRDQSTQYKGILSGELIVANVMHNNCKFSELNSLYYLRTKYYVNILMVVLT